MSQPLWPHQTRVLTELSAAVEQRPNSIVVSSATGTGKSKIIFKLLQFAAKHHLKAIVYCNRQLLFDQLAAGLYAHGITYGARAAGHRANLTRDIQLAMIQTERSQVLTYAARELHPADVVIVDEAHLMKSGISEGLLRRHRKRKCSLIGFSATPARVGHLYDFMLQGADIPEGRRCKALLPARCFAPDMPHRDWLRPAAKKSDDEDDKYDREFSKAKRLPWLKCIIGRIYDHWRVLNPDRLPTVCFGPGCAESLWIAQELYQRGVKAAHIEAKGIWVDGQWHPGTARRPEILERLAGNDIEVLCNRFMLREAFDAPQLFHAILATKFGSQTTYVQAVGRVLRYHDSLPGFVIIQDHGANFWFHGSPNISREWDLDHEKASDATEYVFVKKQEVGDQEPYRCPRCSQIRGRNAGVCSHCGYYVERRSRMIVQLNGTLREQTGLMFPKSNRPTATSDQELALWLRTYFTHCRDGHTFRKAFATFRYRCKEQFGYPLVDPNPTWPGMPLNISDHVERIANVPDSRLTPDPQKQLKKPRKRK